jgi:hypothetical protein
MEIATALVEVRDAPIPRFVPSQLPTIDLLGIRVTNASETEALDWIFRQACGVARSHLNAHCSNVAAIDLIIAALPRLT